MVVSVLLAPECADDGLPGRSCKAISGRGRYMATAICRSRQRLCDALVARLEAVRGMRALAPAEMLDLVAVSGDPDGVRDP